VFRARAAYPVHLEFLNNRRLKPEQIKAIMKKSGDKAAEAFRKGLDHEVTPSKPMKLKTP
jgi:hypothetical protein